MAHEIIESVYRKKRTLFLATANHLCNDYDLAQDIVQEAFCRILKYSDKLESERHCSILITRIMQQRWSNMYKSHNIFLRHRDRIGSEFCMSDSKAAAPRIDFYPLANKKMMEVRKLPEQQRWCIQGGVLEGMGQIELAAIYGMNRASICGHRHNAFEKLKRADVTVFKKKVFTKPSSKKGKCDWRAEVILSMRATGSNWKEIAAATGLTAKKVRGRHDHYMKRSQN